MRVRVNQEREPTPCVSRSGWVRPDHSLDRDGRCVFCDRLEPESGSTTLRLVELGEEATELRARALLGREPDDWA